MVNCPDSGKRFLSKFLLRFKIQMASTNSSLKIHELCRVAPPSATHFSFSLTFFDLLWIKFHPVERLFFYSIPYSDSHLSYFYDSVIPKLKRSLSLTLQHFFPLAGNIVWPADSKKPIIQYSPGDGVSLVIAESDADFDHLSDDSPCEAIESRFLVPHLDSSDSFASVISLQITLFQNKGFCIGISAHHAVLDGKSSTMFMKAWAYLCQTGAESPSLPPELKPFLNRESFIKDPAGLGDSFIEQWTDLAAKFDPTNTNDRSVKILSNTFAPIVDTSARATFQLSRADLDKIKKRVLQIWDRLESVDGEQTQVPSKPPTVSTFVATLAYVSVCIAKAIEIAERDRKKFALGLTVDCRARLEPPIPENYFGNCVSSHFVDTQPGDFTKEDSLAIVAKKIYNTIKMLDKKGVLDGAETLFARWMALLSEGVQGMGVAGSTRFGVYRTDFGWGCPAKVEILSIDRNIVIGMAESRDGKSGVEVGLVLKKNVMDHFVTSFHEGLKSL